MNGRHVWAGTAAALISNIIWGSSFIASKTVLLYSPPLFATVVRFLIALVFFLIIGFLKKNNFQFNLFVKNIHKIVGLGVCAYSLLYAFQMAGLKNITSSQSAAIMLMAPLFTLTFEMFTNRKIKINELFAIFVSFLAAWFIINNRVGIDFTTARISGAGTTVIAALLLALSAVQTKNILTSQSSKDLSVFNLTFYSMAIGTAALLPLVIFEHLTAEVPASLSLEFWLYSGYLGIVCSLLAFLLWNWSISTVSPLVASVAMYIKTPVALILGSYLLKDYLPLHFYIATLTIVLALFSNSLFKIRGAK